MEKKKTYRGDELTVSVRTALIDSKVGILFRGT